MAALAVEARPVGVGEHQHAILDDAADHGDMAERQARLLRKGDHRADARAIAAIISSVGLIPPGPGIAVDLDSRGLARERDALADIVKQRTRLGGAAEDAQERCDESEGGALHHSRKIPKGDFSRGCGTWLTNHCRFLVLGDEGA